MKVAICVCTCKRPIPLGRLLDSLAHIKLGRLPPESVELIVIDNEPTGTVRAICESTAKPTADLSSL